MKLYQSRIDLSSEIRQGVIATLNLSLADAIDLSTQSKQAHWNVRGNNFKALHELFDEIHEMSEEHIDLLAERITALGGIAEGTIATVAEKSRLPKYPSQLQNQEAHVKALADGLAQFGSHIRQGIKEADELGDAGTSDLFTEISRSTDKYLWMLEAHIELA
ncbi:MAG: DNA starvation/stationary phase protection protein Dps [Bacteroidota bacterium]